MKLDEMNIFGILFKVELNSLTVWMLSYMHIKQNMSWYFVHKRAQKTYKMLNLMAAACLE